MPAVFSQNGLRQNAPATEPVKMAPKHHGLMAEKTKRLIALWGDESKSVEEIALEAGYANAKAAYQAASYHNLPYRAVRPRKGTD